MAQEKKKTLKLEIKKVRLTKSQKAPFSGFLLSNAALAKIITGYESKIREQRLLLKRNQQEAVAKLEFAGKVCKARVAAKENLIKLSKVSCQRTIAFYEKAVKGLNQPSPWHQNPALYLFLGLLAGGSICVGASAALNQGSK